METAIREISVEELDSPHIMEAARQLEEGAVIGLPTETVYGLAADMENGGAMKRLKNLKARADKPFTVHLADAAEFETLVPDLYDRARKLGEAFWPGPLTIVVPHGETGIGARVPAHPVTREIIQQTRARVVIPSANPAEEPPAQNADEVLKYFEGQIPLIVDSGPATLGESSTVVRFRDELRWEILREGLISKIMVAKVVCKRILFVCTGNSCRSPMAEVVCRSALAQKLGVKPDDLVQEGYLIESAGTAAVTGGGASLEAIDVMAERAYDLSKHTTQNVTPDLLEAADKVVVMAHRHKDTILRLMPEMEDKIQLLDPEGVVIEDPVGGSLSDYKYCAARIEELVRNSFVPSIQ